MEITLLYFDDCPNWTVTGRHLDELEREFDNVSVTRRLVETPDEAVQLNFRGSPSILVDGADPFADAGDPVGLSCRIYQTPEGPAGNPTIDQIRSAITAGL